MSIFPFISESSKPQEATELPVFREYAYDFEKNCLKTNHGITYLIEKNEALRVWIYKALLTERFRYLAYTEGFGSDAHTLIGRSVNPDITYSELKRFIVECLMVNPYINELSEFRFEKTGSSIKADFNVTTVYGDIPYTTEWKDV